MTDYKLIKTELKSGKKLYQVIDSEGNVKASRTSKRDYVACTVNGEFYFGRRDLVGKGDHGRLLNMWRPRLNYDSKMYEQDRALCRRVNGRAATEEFYPLPATEEELEQVRKDARNILAALQVVYL